MSSQIACAHCKEPIEGDAVLRLGKSYCCAACAFEATGRPRPKQCGVPVEDRESRAHRHPRSSRLTAVSSTPETASE